MSKLVHIYVVDHEGEGIYGIPVKLYQCPKHITDKHGKVTISIATPDVTIYINGFTGYDGATRNLENTLYFNNLGEMLSGWSR